MKKAILGLLALVVVALAGVAFSVTLDGERIVPVGDGTVVLEAGEFEAFPLPESVTQFLPEDDLSYFVAMMRMVPDGPAHPTTAHMVEIELAGQLAAAGEPEAGTAPVPSAASVPGPETVSE